MDGELPLGGLFFGKCLWEKPDDLFGVELKKRLRGLRYDFIELEHAAGGLSVVSARRIHEAAEFLFVLLYQTTELDPRVVHWRRQKTQQQSSISEIIHETKKMGSDEPYPYESERELIAKVKIGDRTGAKEILNNLLGAILFHSPGDMNILKARLVELLSVLSRAATQGGVDIHILLNKNLDYINKVLTIDNQDDLCAWISRALDDFIESVYSCQDARKMGQLRPAIEFMEGNFDRPISLADIAHGAHLSISRLAHLFREQMGITLIDYLTNVRINAAKRLLLKSDMNCTQICFQVGYNNQSYFTRTFKQITGMTPRQFKQANRRKL
jgi:two-component system response regulator YesN